LAFLRAVSALKMELSVAIPAESKAIFASSLASLAFLMAICSCCWARSLTISCSEVSASNNISHKNALT